MNLHGKNLIGGRASPGSGKTFSAVNPAKRETLPPCFTEACMDEVEAAMNLAEAAFEQFRARTPEQIAALLDRIAEEIVGLGDELICRAHSETALPEQRLVGERGRTIGQIRMFAELVREGSWVEAHIDRAIPDRKPLPKPDVRRMLVPIGPVVVFAASNFPLAFSVAGGDTIAALAAGNPVIVKTHPAHPGTSELVAQAINAAIEAAEMPPGLFSLLHATSHEVGLRLVQHPAAKAVGFTGSSKAGRALFNAAAARPQPIPVYAEMGSTNPVFLLPERLQQNAAAIAEGLIQSVTLGVGQFCTNPGLVFGLRGESFDAFTEQVKQLVSNAAPGTMLYSALCERFHETADRIAKIAGVDTGTRSTTTPAQGQAFAAVFTTDAETFLKNASLQEEIFGPATILVRCDSPSDFEKIARALPGQLTASVHGTENDLAEHRNLIWAIEQKAGRLVMNGFPTGVEVCPAMHHGGPFPATTDSHFTSVGTGAIKRFARPVCFQNFPDASLPPELQNANPRGIWRWVDGRLTTIGL